MAKRKPLVFVAGEIVESTSTDSLDASNASVTSSGSTEERYLKDRFSDIINVKDFGAKGDGTSNDTAAFKNAVIAAERKNSVIYVPYGTYKVTEPVTGEFITLGHVTFTGGGDVTNIVDLYNDFMRKTGNVSEIITGEKTFTDKVTFSDSTLFSGPEEHTGAETHSGNVTFTGTEIHRGSETHEGSQTFNNPVVFNDNVTFTDENVFQEITQKITQNLSASTLLASENNGFVDPSTINGKLRVDSSEFIVSDGGLTTKTENNIKKLTIDLTNASTATLKKITSIIVKNNGGLKVNSDGKLSVVFKDLDISQITDLCDPHGGIVVNTDSTDTAGYGKLKIDFSQMDDGLMRAIVLAMVQEGGGISVDNKGQLYVDFDNMPTDKFEAMLKTIHVPIWIGDVIGGTRVGTEFYVSNSGADNEDTVTVGNKMYIRGRSKEYPWKTISYATETICKNYNINSREVHINVEGGTYTYEFTDTGINLPFQQKTSGAIVIRPYTGETVNIVGKCYTGTLFRHVGGEWFLTNLNIKLIVTEQQHKAGWTFPSIIHSFDSAGHVTLTRCNLSYEDQTVPANPGTKGYVAARLFNSSAGRIRHRNLARNNENGTPIDEQYENSWSGTKINMAGVIWLFIENSGQFLFLRSGSTAPRPFKINVSGSFSVFAYASFQGTIRQHSTGEATTFNYTSEVTGKRFEVLNSGSIVSSVSAGVNALEWLPGNEPGTVEDSTYSVYK